VGTFLVVGLGLLALVWGAATLSSLAVNGEAVDLSIADAATAIARMGGNGLAWEGAWSPEIDEALPGPGWFWTMFGIEVVALAIVFWPLWRLLGPRVPDPLPVQIIERPPTHPRAARRKQAIAWAEQHELGPDRPAAGGATGGPGRGGPSPGGGPGPGGPATGGAGSDVGGPGAGGGWGAVVEPPTDLPGTIQVDAPDGMRLVLGRARNGSLVVTEKHHSVVALGPSGSGKTTGLAIPAVLEWAGPALVVAAKPDVVSLTWNERRRRGGRTWLFDPSSSMASGPGMPELSRLPPGGHGWSPLAVIEAVPLARNELELDRRTRQWALARRTARWLVQSVRDTPDTTDLPSTWFSTTEQVLAPILLAAGASELSLADLLDWVGRWADDEITGALDQLGVREALAAWDAHRLADPVSSAGSRQILASILYPLGDPAFLARAHDPEITADRFLEGQANTLYVLSPPHHEDRLRPLLATVVSEVIDTAMSRAVASPQGRLAESLLVVLDDTATCVPVDIVTQLASMGGGLGIQLLTNLQDLSQLGRRYGNERALAVANDHRVRVVLPGLTDLTTLDYLDTVISGRRFDPVGAGHSSGGGALSGGSPAAAWIRTLTDGTAGLLYAGLPPTRINLRSWFVDPGLRHRVHPAPPAEARFRWPWLRRRGDELVGPGFPNPLDSDANDAEAARYWESVERTGTLPEERPYDDGSGTT
jgi:type IV secretion system protein VirD4